MGQENFGGPLLTPVQLYSVKLELERECNDKHSIERVNNCDPFLNREKFLDWQDAIQTYGLLIAETAAFRKLTG